ncbi:MAG: WD40/YVTN/BNR-like repeat-containing protein [Bacteroidota bacterium]
MKKVARMIVLIMLVLIYSSGMMGQTKQPVLAGKEKVKLFASHMAMKENSSFKDLHWQYIGPTNISGRCTDVEAVMPRGKSYTIWIGSASGGVWKSENEGSTFEPVFDDMPGASIGDIAIDPANPDIVWVGTGEANIFRSSNAGCGVFKTTDGGKTWRNMGLENTLTIGRIRVHPKNSDIVYVAATGHEWTPNEERGLYKTTDGGRTWEKILYIDEMTGVFDLVLDPKKPNTIYCTTWERMRLKWNDPRTYETTRNSAIWKSTNGGKTWEKIVNGLPEANKLGRIGIDIAAGNPDALYALVDNYEVAYPAEPGQMDSYGRQRQDVIKGATVYKTENGGKNWKQVSGLTPDMKTYMERHSSTYGWVFGQIRVDPSDENTVYIMGIPLSKSTDGGKTFTQLRGPHADHHGLWIDPDNGNYLLNVQDGGLTISYDQGDTWKYPIEELPLAQFYNIEYDLSTPFRVFGSIQDHHSFYTEVDLSRGRDNIRPTEWKNILGAEGTTHAVNKDDNNTIYASSFYGNLARAEIENYPQGQENILPRRYSDEEILRGQWVAPTLLSPHNQDIVYHCMQYVLMSRDRGSTWEYISPDLSYNDPEKMGDISYQTISAFDESPLKFGLLYAGTDDGRVWRTKDGGENWTEIRSDPVPARWVSRITASRYDLGTVYMTQTGRRDDDFQVYIWKSTDFGDTWTDISANIPVGPVNVIREDPVNRNIIYVGSDAGVYVSKDGGENYEVLGDLPYAFVHDLQIHPEENMIIIATHGRGMWVLDANDVNDKDKMRRRRWY